MAYGSDLQAPLRQSGVMARKVLHGTRPRDLPIEHLSRIELVLNLKQHGPSVWSRPRHCWPMPTR
jgi:putative ABC transport system substrate-binding protein